MELRRLTKLNKKAQFADKLLVVISIFIIGIIVFFLNHVNDKMYGELEDTLSNSKYNNTQALTTTQDLRAVENASWDWGFFAIFIGLIIQIIMFSFATRINLAFFWIMIIIDIPILVVGVVLSNIWQEMVAQPEFATTLTRFPITNSILGTYYPIAIVVIIFITSIIMFGKRPDQ